MHSMVSFADIVRTTNRLAFSKADLEVTASVLQAGRARGRDLTFGAPGIATTGDAVLELAGQGIVVVTSQEQLESSFLFTKNDAGRGFFGGQKAVYTVYVNASNDDEWAVGSVFKMWTIAMTSIGNIYRHNGFG
jgi:hypothetical protein